MEGTSDEAFHWKSRKGEGKNGRKDPPAGENSGSQRKPGAEAQKDREGRQADLAKWTDVTLVRGELDAAFQAYNLSEHIMRNIKQNLAWAFGYNSAAIPLATLGLLHPTIAAAAMALSSVTVVSNALRLKGVEIGCGR